MEKQSTVRFWDNMGKKRSMIVHFPSIEIAEAFIETYQNYGSIRQFSADVYENYEKYPPLQGSNRHDEFVYIHGKNDLPTFLAIYNTILYDSGGMI